MVILICATLVLHIQVILICDKCQLFMKIYIALLYYQYMISLTHNQGVKETSFFQRSLWFRSIFYYSV